MGHNRLPGNPPIELVLRRSARARRITLRISSLDGRVSLTVPNGVREAEALAFARSKEAWIRQHLAGQVTRTRIEAGVEIPVEGAVHEIRHGTGRGVKVAGRVLEMRCDDGRAGVRLQAWCKARARERLAAASDHYAERLGKRYTKITLRDTRSRWGSCSSSGALNYSWRLVLAPPEVLQYVAAHEVAHLAHMHHGRAFWDEVERLYGAHDAERQWLKRHGASLHAFDFSPQSEGA